ncbi:DNA-binding transcriptional LysR family regulator [Bradyrhizobium sp. LM6.9]
MSAAVHAKVVIIGSGPAGYTAAIYAARAMLEPILIQGIQPGGQLTITTDVENYPGFADVIQGPWLMEQMEKQALHVGTQIKTDLVIKLDTTQRPFRLTCDSGDVYLAETVILATGAQARWLGISSEENFKGFGVSACATCDGFFYRGKEVVVVGGGNTAVEEALFLTNFASQVTVGSPPRPFPRRAHPAGPPIQASQDQGGLGQRHRRDLRRRQSGQGHSCPSQERQVRRAHRAQGRRCLHRYRACAGDRAGERPSQAQAVGLCRGRPELDRHLGARPVRRRRRRRRDLSSSGHSGRPRLHGGSRSRTFLGPARQRARGSGIKIMARTRDGFTDMDWDKLKVFHAAAEAGSFTHAGEQLGLSQSAVSRQVSALEQELSVSLFHRHARGLILTEQGDLLFRTAHDVFMQLQAARAKLTDSRERPSGDLKITTTPGVGINWLIPRLGEFTALYPEIRISLIVTDEELDLSMREADVAIRTRKPTQPDLIQRKLFAMGFHAYCSPDYIKRFGTPRTLEELDSHRIITLSDGTFAPHLQNRNWLVEAGRNGSGPREAYFRVNNILGLVRACQQGLGIAALPDYLIEEQSRLVQLFGESDSIQLDTYFVYPEELKTVARVQVFRDFVVSKAQRWPS